MPKKSSIAMIEQKLKVGRYLQMPALSMGMPVVPGSWVTHAYKPMMIEESEGVFTKTSALSNAVVPHAKVHRNFQWLQWIPYGISYVPVNNVDVITGPMSGCWLVTYRHAGVVRAVHVSTSEIAASNLLLKQVWNQFAVTNPAQIIGGFNPSRAWNPPPAKIPGDNFPKIFGVMTTDNRYYSVHFYSQQTTGPNPTRINGLFRISGVKEIASASKYDLCHI